METKRAMLKRTAAAIMSITMAFGAAAPAMQGMAGNVLSVYAAEITEGSYDLEAQGWTFGSFKEGGHIFEYACKPVTETEVGNGSSEAFMLINVTMGGRTLSIPRTVVIDGVTHTVNALCSSFGTGISAESVYIPDTVTDIGNNVFSNSSVGKLNVEGGVKNIGVNFFYGAKNLIADYVKIDTSSLEDLGRGAFVGTDIYKANDRGAVVVSGCLLNYSGENVTTLKVQDLSDTPVTVLAGDCFVTEENAADDDYLALEELDITGVQTLSADALNRCGKLTKFKGKGDLKHIDPEAVKRSAWYEANKDLSTLILGDHIFHLDGMLDETLDFTSDKFRNVTSAEPDAFENLSLDFPKVLKIRRNEPLLKYLPVRERSSFDRNGIMGQLEEVYIDGEKVTVTDINEVLPGEIRDHYKLFEDSPFTHTLADERVKLIFDELGIEYYGPFNDKVGTLSREDEIFITQKLYETVVKEFRISDEGTEDIEYMLNLGADADNFYTYSRLLAFMLECAGVDAETPNSYFNSSRCWVSVYLGENNDLYFLDPANALEDMKNSSNGRISYDSFMFTMGLAKHEGKQVYLDNEVAVALNPDWDESYQTMERSAVNADAPYYGDVNGDFIRDETDMKLIQSYLVLPAAIQEKLLAGQELTAEEKKAFDTVEACYEYGNRAGQQLVYFDDNGDLNFDIRNGDLNMDGKITMSDALMANTMFFGMNTTPAFGIRESLSGADINGGYDLDEKQKLFGYGNLEACIWEGFYSDHQLSIEEFAELVDRMYAMGEIIIPAPIPKPSKPIDQRPDDEPGDPAEGDTTPQEDTTGQEDEPTDEPAVPDIIYGDLNGDGEIDVTDVMLIASHVKAIRALTDDRMEAADVDGNGDVNVTDLTSIAAHVKGIRPLKR
ncbi:dockerin type I domain-containing protein [Ruminococcus sp.]|uniref:dockerin type I domain-containing protein n=1 Tax=Ruminococcus sp. TaxID=41978 RepID=UPI0025D4E30D|nr:dockerin type I domain-containing protein [Ruminococcus sp.]MBQ8967292.1 leucine-rich repeat protein [Ruminococcus sp.]